MKPLEGLLVISLEQAVAAPIILALPAPISGPHMDQIWVDLGKNGNHSRSDWAW